MFRYGSVATAETIYQLCMIVRFPRYPAADVPAVLPILVTILVPKPVFLVSDNHHVRDDKTKTGVSKQSRGPKEPGFCKQDEHHTNIHWISDVTIEADYDQFLRFVERSQRSLTDMREGPYAPEENGCSNHENQHRRVLSQ